MIKSMTGYGVGTASDANVKYTVEIKSLNSKFLELSVRLPKTVADKELQLRGNCTKIIERGKVNLTAVAEYTDQTALAATINVALLRKYFAELDGAAQKLGARPDREWLFEQSLAMPDVVAQHEEEANPDEAIVLMEAFDRAFVA